jgi:hypothetical protein
MTPARDLERAFTRATAAARAAGLPDADCWTLQTGSKTYGRAFRLFVRDPQTGGLSSVPGLTSGYLGTTAREAASALDMLAVGLRLAAA